MRYFRPLIILVYFSILSHLVLSYIFGDSGLLAYRELARYNAKLTENIAELRSINSDLEKKCNFMQENDNLILHARANGMIAKNERIILIDSSTETKNAALSLGSLCKSQIKSCNRITDTSNLRTLSLIFALIFLAINLIFNKNACRNKSERHHKPGLRHIAE